MNLIWGKSQGVKVILQEDNVISRNVTNITYQNKWEYFIHLLVQNLYEITKWRIKSWKLSQAWLP
jgi:hypothetical protein